MNEKFVAVIQTELHSGNRDLQDLYAIPLVVRNEFLALKEGVHNSSACERLEDIWVELDGLVANCFV